MNVTVDSFVCRISGEMHAGGQFSASRTCLSVLHGLHRAACMPQIMFAHLTPGLLQDFVHCLQRDRCGCNTISLYLRTLQTLCRKAQDAGVARIPAHLFDKVAICHVPSARRSVSVEVLRMLRDAPLENKAAKYAFARDLFMLSFYLRGIPFVDLARLRCCDLRDNVLTYRRSKTGKPARVLLEPCALQIIKRYATRPSSSSSYLLPIIRRQGSREDEYRQYESALRLYNKHLAALSNLLCPGVKLTSYVARHSWATVAHDLGVDIADISEALCHSSEKMTRNYIRSFTPDRLAGVNRRVIASLEEALPKKSGGHTKWRYGQEEDSGRGRGGIKKRSGSL